MLRKTKPLTLLNFVLAICLVTVLLFTSGTITGGSGDEATDYTVKGRDYDPWLDYNEDGNIDMKDIYAEILAFGTSGDPTKNVNVTNWPLKCKLHVKRCYNWCRARIGPPVGMGNHFIFPSADYLCGFKQGYLFFLVTGTDDVDVRLQFRCCGPGWVVYTETFIVTPGAWYKHEIDLVSPSIDIWCNQLGDDPTEYMDICWYFIA